MKIPVGWSWEGKTDSWPAVVKNGFLQENGNVRRYLTVGRKIALWFQIVHAFGTLKTKIKQKNPALHLITSRKYYWDRSVVCWELCICSSDNLTVVSWLEVVYCCSSQVGLCRCERVWNRDVHVRQRRSSLLCSGETPPRAPCPALGSPA